MNEIREKELKNASERKQKIEIHVQSIDDFMTKKDKIDNLSDLELLRIAKESEETIKLATKNIVNSTFSLSMLPELKKDVEISNFGKQLKNALRDQEVPKTQKSKKPSKKPTKSNIPKSIKAQKDSQNPPSPLNESTFTELTTPVLISAKSNFFEKDKKPTTAPEAPQKKGLVKKEMELPPPPKTITNQVLSSRNQKINEIKPNACSFSYQPSKIAEKLATMRAIPKPENQKKVNESNGRNEIN